MHMLSAVLQQLIDVQEDLCSAVNMKQLHDGMALHRVSYLNQWVQGAQPCFAA
jgi:hypothetical protein